MQGIERLRSVAISACCGLLILMMTSCAADAGSPYAEWASQNEFQGASDYWVKKTKRTNIPESRAVPFPKYPGSKLIDYKDNSGSGEVLSRMVLVADAPFHKVQQWYKARLPDFCAYKKKEKPVSEYVFAQECNTYSKAAGNYDLFTTNPNLTVKEIGSHLRDFYGKFMTIIEVAYVPAGSE